MKPVLIRLLLLIVIFVSVFLLSQVIARVAFDRRLEKGAVNRHLRLIRSGVSQADINYTLLKNAPPALSVTASWWERTYVGVIRMIMMSGITFSARALFVGALIAAGGLFGFALVVLGLKGLVTPGMVQLDLVMSAAICLGIPLMLVNRVALRRRKRMESQFPTSLDVFVRALRAGHPIGSAIELISHEMEDPIGSEFGRVHDEVSYGANLTDALLGMADRWALEDMRMFVVCVSVQSETGGNLAEILYNLAGVIRDRANMYMQVRALSSEGKMSGWMLTALPIFSFTILFIYNPAFYLDVATDPIFEIGFPALMVLYAIGVFLIRKIIDIKV
jgi:tight adherence protein B